MLGHDFPYFVATHLVSHSEVGAYVCLDEVPQPNWIQQHITRTSPANVRIISRDEFKHFLTIKRLTTVREVTLIVESDGPFANDPPLGTTNLNIVVLHIALVHSRAAVCNVL